MKELFLCALIVCTLTHVYPAAGIPEYSIEGLLLCGTYLNMSYVKDLYAMRFKVTNSGVYWKNMDCTVGINSLPGEKLMLYFEGMAIEETVSCSNDWLELYDGSSKEYPYISGLTYRLCGFSAPSGIYQTSREYLTLYFKSNNYLEYSGFDMIVTRYRDGYCKNTECRCNNGHCIDKSLVCNGFNPCGDHSDCPGHDDNDSSLEIHLGGIIGIAGGSLVVIAVVVVFVILITRRRRQRIYRERIVTVESTKTYGTSRECNNQSIPPPYSKQPPYTSSESA